MTGAEGVRRRRGANLSGKRTEWSAADMGENPPAAVYRARPEYGRAFYFDWGVCSGAFLEAAARRSVPPGTAFERSPSEEVKGR